MTMNRTYTRRLNEVLNDLDDEFKSMCDTSAFARKLAQLKAAPRSSRPTVLIELYVMLDRCDISYERDKDNEYYEQLLSSSDIPDSTDIETRMITAMCSKYHEFPTPEQYMLRIVNTLSSSSDGWDNDTLRLRILKQFIKYGNYLSDADFGGKMIIKKYVSSKLGKPVNAVAVNDVLENLDDDIFLCLDDVTKDNKDKYALIKLADDLASGKFRMGGATKRDLYLFAMVYGMTYTTDSPDMIRDFESDIEKNLFTDYYSNNLMRYISNAYRNGTCQFEADPSGQGINYKNFVEMIYIYFINSKHTPLEKIQLSAQMIARVQDTKVFEPDEVPEQGTTYYRELFTEDILALTENEFEEFICNNYNCNTGKRVGGIQLETGQNTAFNEYQRMIRELKKCITEHHDISDCADSLEACDYGLWFADINALRKNMYMLEGIDRERLENFLILLDAVNNFLISGAALHVKNSSTITRTSILVAWYYYFNAIHESDPIGIWDSFETLYNSFKAGIDPVLKESGYQLLNGKNIFDLLIAFSSYAFMNL